MKFRVIYLWRGERHVADSGLSKAEASKLVATFRADKWQAWMEEL